MILDDWGRAPTSAFVALEHLKSLDALIDEHDLSFSVVLEVLLDQALQVPSDKWLEKAVQLRNQPGLTWEKLGEAEKQAVDYNNSRLSRRYDAKEIDQ
jgi:hypothetical protein